MHRSIALLAALSLSLFLSAQEAENRVSVPRAAAPVIDGKISNNEWKAATRVVLGNNQGHALLMHDGNYLYIGLVGAKAGIGSVCVKGKSGVRVLHASAALGTAAFEQGENKKWTLTRGFTFTNRDTGDSPAAMEERKKMLATDGWFASTSHAASPEREYQIPIRGHKEVPIVIGFMSFTRQQEKLFYWPGSVEDDCAEAQLARGFTDREYTFDPDNWGVAVLE